MSLHQRRFRYASLCHNEIGKGVLLLVSKIEHAWLSAVEKKLGLLGSGGPSGMNLRLFGGERLPAHLLHPVGFVVEHFPKQVTAKRRKKELSPREHAIHLGKDEIIMKWKSFGPSLALLLWLAALRCVAQEPAGTPAGLNTFAPTVEKVAPNVVTVFTTQSVTRNVNPFPFSDDALRQFFGLTPPGRQGKEKLQGLGSGVIVSADGYSPPIT
jgi:hypothetical protein